MLEFLLLFVVLFFACKPLGVYMARVYGGEPVWTKKILGKIENAFYGIAGIDPSAQMHWRKYLLALMTFSLVGFIMLYGLLCMQHYLPFNPQHLPAVPADLAFNIAVSFLTNTNWQSYVPEQTLSYFSQAVGLCVQNYLSAGVGMAAAAAFFRGFSRKQSATIGNFWADLVRGVLYILLPLSLMFALILASQGVIQNLEPYAVITSLEAPAGADEAPTLAMGPVASQEAIKQLGGNGGGFFNANSAHPFENPTPLTNFLELLAILLIPVSFVYSFGVVVGDKRQAWSILGVMTILFVPVALFAILQEGHTSPALSALTLDISAGNMEGKETRFGSAPSALWAAAATATSNGSVNSMHDSYLPLGGLAPLLLIQFGEIIYGGAGTGMIGMLIFVIITIFIGGLMVGRTPEYLGKKFGPFEIKMASLIIILPAVLILGGAALAVSLEAGRAGVLNPGPQGFSEIIYALSSAANNNGSAFAGLSANSPFYNSLLAVVMFLGRFFILIPALALAGSVAAKNTTPVSAGTLPTHTLLFAGMLTGVIILVGVLTYAPVLALGPVAEHLLLYGY